MCDVLCQAVDAVVEGSVANALVACRPPGHHAGPTHTFPNTPLLEPLEASSA